MITVEYLTRKEAAQYLGLKPTTLSNNSYRKEIPCIKQPNGSVVYLRTVLDRYLAEKHDGRSDYKIIRFKLKENEIIKVKEFISFLRKNKNYSNIR